MKPSKVTGSYAINLDETIQYTVELGTAGPLDVVADLLTAAQHTVVAGISQTLADVLEQTRGGIDTDTGGVDTEPEGSPDADQ